MKKPLKESWLSYYVATPLRSVLCSLKECLETTAIKLKGGWYCEYCHKMHCRRTYKFKLLFTSTSCAAECCGSLGNTRKETGKYVCSLGKDQIMEHGWRPDSASAMERLQSAVSAIGDAFKGGM